MREREREREGVCATTAFDARLHSRQRQQRRQRHKVPTRDRRGWGAEGCVQVAPHIVATFAVCACVPVFLPVVWRATQSRGPPQTLWSARPVWAAAAAR